MIDAILFYVFGGGGAGLGAGRGRPAQPDLQRLRADRDARRAVAIFGLLGSPFIAALQVVVYAGAIMVLFLFVLMLLNVKPEEGDKGGGLPFKATGSP